ncbi:MAG TPA: DNA polymerase III subunit alpha, partial [Deinococcales bacterium]|nr:DNA polymerase III subunit alpha [Deinococcales bacterium]
KAVFKDVARVMNLPYAEADRISKLVPIKFGRSASLEEAARTVPDLKGALNASPDAKKVFDTALSLEGLTRHASIHASGVIIGREPLTNLVPLMRDTSGEGVVCQLDMSSVEDIGLIKMDFLGLRTLSFLEEAIRIVRESRGITLSPNDFPIDDPATFELISRGETKGVFQFEGGGITDAARKLKPRRIQDIIALSALYRPGPMENIPTYIERHHGREQVRYDEGAFNLPNCAQFLEPILRETYGIPVYQEQIMQIASRVAGYSLGQADLLRRAMGKKKIEEMAKERVKFEQGAAAANNISSEEANRLFDLLEAFANYGFNKSHSAAYAFLSFQTAYIKAHFPVEFMAALLTVERRDSDKVAEYVNAARQMKLGNGETVRVTPPDINESNDDFRVLGNTVIFGLSAVKGLGDGAVEEILAARSRGGKFHSLADLCARVTGTSLNRRGLESLVKAGALDAFGPRDALLASLDDALAYGAGQASIALEGMDALFSMTQMAPEPALRAVPPAATPEEARDRALEALKQEKDSLGLYLTGHPLQFYPGMLEAGSCKAPEIAAWLASQPAKGGNGDARGRRRAVLTGMISAIARKPTKSGGMMARFNLTDDRGTVELVAFSRAYDRVNEKLAEDAPALCIVEVEPDGENLRVTVEEVITYEEAQALPSVLYADVDLDEATPERLDHLDELLNHQDGVRNMPLRLRLNDGASYEVWDLDAKGDMTLEETLRRECPWLSARRGVNGEALLAKYAPKPRPWENRRQAVEA